MSRDNFDDSLWTNEVEFTAPPSQNEEEADNKGKEVKRPSISTLNNLTHVSFIHWPLKELVIDRTIT